MQIATAPSQNLEWWGAPEMDLEWWGAPEMGPQMGQHYTRKKHML
jgi:hypothetical protein